MAGDRGESFQQELRERALANLTEVFVHGENLTSQANARMAADFRGTKLTITREPMRRMLADMQRLTGTWIDQVNEAGTERMLSSIVDPQDRLNIKREALTAAIGYWEQKLAEPDGAMTDLTTGRMRLTRLRQRLDALNGDQ